MGTEMKFRKTMYKIYKIMWNGLTLKGSGPHKTTKAT